MHAVVNHLPIKAGIDWSALAAKVDAFNADIEHADFRGLSLIKVSDTEAIVLVLFANLPTLQALSKDVAAPWFAEHVRPLLAGPVSRSVGEIVAGAFRTNAPAHASRQQ
jgi:hypothetical protein